MEQHEIINKIESILEDAKTGIRNPCNLSGRFNRLDLIRMIKCQDDRLSK